jgi:hypothetical protein
MGIRRQLISSSGFKPGSTELDLAVKLACYDNGVILPFNVPGFVVGCLVLCLPVLVVSILTYLIARAFPA